MVFAVLLVLGSWFLWKKKTLGLNRYDLLLAWALKIGASLVFLWVYIHYYGWGSLTADPDAFMKESVLLASVADTSVWDYLLFMVGAESQEMVDTYLSATHHWSAGDLALINDSRNVIRINSLICLFSDGNSLVHSLVFSFISLLGFRELYLAFAARINYSGRVFWFALIALPSLIFWTGSMLKEPMMILGLCLILGGVFGTLSRTRRAWRVILGIALMLAFKPYVFLCLFPALVFYFMANYVFRKRLAVSFVVLMALMGLLAVLFPGKRDDATYYLTRKQYDFINIGRGGLHAYADTCFFYFRPDQFKYLEFRPDSTVYLQKPQVAKLVTLGKATPFRDIYLQPNTTRWINYYETQGCKSTIPVTSINASFGQLVRNMPEAFSNAAFRPFFGDPGGMLKFPAVLETLLLFGFFLLQFRYWKNASQETRLVVVTLLIFATALLVLIGWTTPVLGAIVRYRIPAYLSILTAGLILHKHRKITT